MQQASPSAKSDSSARQRRALRNVIFSCVAVLVVGQLLIAALSLAALLRLGTESAADRLSLIAGRTAGQVQAGLHLGKPLTQYFGLTLVFEHLQRDIPELQAAAMVLDDGTVLGSIGPSIDATGLLRELRLGASRASESVAGGGGSRPCWISCAILSSLSRRSRLEVSSRRRATFSRSCSSI